MDIEKELSIKFDDETSKYGFQNDEGEIVIPCEFDDAWDFNNGIAFVAKGRKLTHIDMEGTEFKNKEVDIYREGFEQVRAQLIDHLENAKSDEEKEHFRKNAWDMVCKLKEEILNDRANKNGEENVL